LPRTYVWHSLMRSAVDFHTASMDLYMLLRNASDISAVDPQWWTFHIARAATVDDSNSLDVLTTLTNEPEFLIRLPSIRVTSWSPAITMGMLVLLPLDAIEPLDRLRWELSRFSAEDGRSGKQADPDHLDLPHVRLASGDPRTLAAHAADLLTARVLRAPLTLEEVSLGILRSDRPVAASSIWSQRLTAE
jgi:hypothetical protein